MEIEVIRIYKVDEKFPPILKKCKKSIYVDEISSIEESLYFEGMTELSLVNGEIIVIEDSYKNFKELIKQKIDEKKLGIGY